jgi:hypothetical protein
VRGRSGAGQEQSPGAPPKISQSESRVLVSRPCNLVPIIQKYGDSRFKKRDTKRETQVTFRGDVNYVLVLASVGET